MSTHPLSGAFTPLYTPGLGKRSHSSDTDRPEISRGSSRARAYFTRQTHKADRREGRAAVIDDVRTWREDVEAEHAAYVDAWFADILAGRDPEYVAGYAGFDEHGFDAGELDADEQALLELEQLHAEWLEREPADMGLEQLRLLADPDAGTWREGLHPQASFLGYATAVTLEEANTAGLRVTNAPSGYTYGRS